MVRRENVDTDIPIRRQVNQQIKNCIELFLHNGNGFFIFVCKHFSRSGGKFLSFTLQTFEKFAGKIQKFLCDFTKMIFAVASKQGVPEKKIENWSK